jgi:hypothetical protein
MIEFVKVNGLSKLSTQILPDFTQYITKKKIKARSILSKVYRVFKGLFGKKVINDTITSSAQNQIIKYNYNNVVRTITYRVVKRILKFNVLKHIFENGVAL